MNKSVLRIYLILFSACLLMLTGKTAFSQERALRIMFYNVENYFDIMDDSTTYDEEFTPEGDKHWDEYRLQAKSMNIYRVIAAVGELTPPDIVGFAEIENRYVLNQLLYETPLASIEYKVAHFESPDFRGIDVGLIYNSATIKKLDEQALHVALPDYPGHTTRDILYFKALLSNKDTLHLFINHWPSRRGGQAKSEPNRVAAAKVLRHTVDSLLRIDACANIVITGDFNDEPENMSISETLGAHKTISQTSACLNLYNLSAQLQKDCECGTYRYRNDWNMLDQFMVSGGLLDATSDTYTKSEAVKIGEMEFLFDEDNKYGGRKPSRTYLGPRYLGGYSDHLPVFLDIYFQ